MSTSTLESDGEEARLLLDICCVYSAQATMSEEWVSSQNDRGKVTKREILDVTEAFYFI